MINVLLVEDELLVRSGMRSLVEWEKEGFHLSEASNGKEAIEILNNQAMDIVITDIKMPVMDGLELIEALHEKKYPCEIIILSSYDEFQYVRKAMKFGVRDYIHKPTMTPEDIVSTLKEITQKISLEKTAQDAHQIILDTVSESKNIMVDKVVRQALHSQSIDERMLELLQDSPFICKPLYLSLYCFPYLSFHAHEKQEDLEEETMQAFIKTNEINVDQDELIYFKEDDVWIFVSTICVHEQFLHYAHEKLGVELCSECMKEELKLHTLYQSFQHLKGEFEFQLDKWKQESELNPLIKQAIEYIRQSYDRQLTLDKVSEHVHVSPSYLSRLFDKEVGFNFIEYITKVRMEQAELLLLKTNDRIYEIAEKVGYKNTKYFLKVFKKHFSMTPGEYKSINRMK